MKDFYTLRQVVDLTGLSEFTLRGWENRYSAFLPKRTNTGRRQYSAADLQKAMLLRELLKRNHRIGDVAHLSVKKLSDLMDEETAPGSLPSAPTSTSTTAEHLLKLTALQEWDEVEKILRSQFKKSASDSLNHLILPVLQSLNRAVVEGHVTISQEHILSALLKEHIYHLRSLAPVANSSSRFVMATPEGDFHEIGILVAHLMMSLNKVRSLFLGPNSPKKELCETALRFGATHVLIGSTISRKEGACEDLATFVHFLDKNLPAKTALWIGGRNAYGFEAQLNRPHKIFKSLEDLRQALENLKR